MMNTIWAIVREGRIVRVENVAIPEGTRVLVTLLPEAEAELIGLALNSGKSHLPLELLFV